MMDIKTVLILGAGQMGRGIAQTFATSDFSVYLMDLNPFSLEKAAKNMQDSIEKLIKKEKISEAQGKKALSLIHYVNSLEDGACKSQFVIEAVSEEEKVKEKIFRDINSLFDEKAIFASNTSSIPITRLASYSGRPAQFIGMHFMNPVPLMKLVEIIPGLATSQETIDLTLLLAKKLGKQVTLSKDYPGFVINRILMPMINEAFTVLMEGIASAEDIDCAMQLGTNHPMGPLALADFIGLDTCLSILEIMHKDLGDPRYRPNALLRQYVNAGWFGKKAGRGVYFY